MGVTKTCHVVNEIKFGVYTKLEPSEFSYPQRYSPFSENGRGNGLVWCGQTPPKVRWRKMGLRSKFELTGSSDYKD